MTKQELLKRIAEIPDDAEVVAYHITAKNDEGQNTRGGFDGRGENILLHAGAVLYHVAKSTGLEMQDAAKVVIAFYNTHKKQEERENIRIDARTLAKMLTKQEDEE